MRKTGLEEDRQNWTPHAFRGGVRCSWNPERGLGHSYHQAEHQTGRKGGKLESSPALEPLSLPAWRGQSSQVEMSRSGEKNRYQTPESSLKTSAPCLRGPHHLESSLAWYWGGHSGHHFSRVGCIPAVPTKGRALPRDP